MKRDNWCRKMSSNVHNSNQPLSDKQSLAVVAFMSQSTDAAVAMQVGVQVRTIQRWKKLPAFKQAVRDKRAELFDHVTSLAQCAAVHAIQSLLTIVQSSESKDAVKVSAANAILKHARQSMELDDLLIRVEELSNRIDGSS